MKRIKLEVLGKELVIEFDRESMIKMEEMGYNAIDPTSKLLTNFEIMIYGGLLKNQPKTTWKEAIEICEGIRTDYDTAEIMPVLSDMINDVFFPGGTKKKKSFKVEKA